MNKIEEMVSAAKLSEILKKRDEDKMKKTILSAIAGIMLAVFLGVSTAFAVNYWYRIDNSAGVQTVTMGRAVYLSVENEAGTATGVYQGSTIQFNTVTVVAPQWDKPSGNVINVEMPKFHLILNILQQDGENWVKANPVPGISVRVAYPVSKTKTVMLGMDENENPINSVVLLEDVQGIQEELQVESFDIDITLIVADDLPELFAGGQFRLQVEIVPNEVVKPGDSYIGGTVPNA